MPEIQLPALPGLQTIRNRLPLIFSENIPIISRNNVIGDMAARTVFVMLYIGAVEGSDQWVQPAHIYNMSDLQAAKIDNQSRLNWAKKRKWPEEIINPWYKNTTRESIRDETILLGFVPLNACVIEPSIETTQGFPRYGLKHAFAALFDENLTGSNLSERIATWQRSNLSREAITATALQPFDDENLVTVQFPNSRRIRSMNLPPGKSSNITKEVIETFSKKFLHSPHVISISTSETGFTPIDDRVIQSTNLNFSTVDVQKMLPDVILYDIYLGEDRQETLLVFIEVVATGGVMDQVRKEKIQTFLQVRGYDINKVAYGTAFYSRSLEEYNKKNISQIAWGTFVWFVTEPDKIIIMKNNCVENCQKLSDLII